jgi:carbamoyltransferase
VLVNTSFNVRGQPIVCSPEVAVDTFLMTEIDFLVLGEHLVLRPTADRSLA